MLSSVYFQRCKVNDVGCSYSLFSVGSVLCSATSYGGQWTPGQVQCGKPACRQTRITRAPLTLVVQLKRFSFTDGKSRRDNSNIKIFPNLLTLKAVSDGIIIKHSYRLRATINHQGSLESGHYWALVANSRCSFLKCDDFRVFETNRWDLNSESSYLLFFSRAE